MVGLNRKAVVTANDIGDVGVQLNVGTVVFAARHQQVDDVLGRGVAKQLTVIAFVIGDGVVLNHFDEVVLGEAFQRRDAKARILRHVIVRGCEQIGKIAAPTTGNPDLFADIFGVVEHRHPPPPFRCDARAHQTGGARADDEGVKTLIVWGHGLVRMQFGNTES